jgi:methyl-accepting chemotaxis protein
LPAQDGVPTIESTGIADRGDDADTAVSPPEANREADSWFAEVARAVGRAQETKSPEAWQEAARVAIVVSEVAQTMQVMAEAEVHAQRAAQTAQEVTQMAALAEKTAAEANGTVAQSARTARIAADEARAAAQTAEEARRTAERAAEEVPKSAGLAKVAVQEAAKAVGNAKGIAEVVAKARLANTQEAWSEALSLVTTRSETTRDHTGGADTAL